MSKTRVINIDTGEPYDIYIGRGRGSIWGNPFTHIKNRKTKAEFIVSTRKEALENYRKYLLDNQELMSKLEELRGKTLGCFCKPKACHGDIIIELLSKHKLF